ncbi:dnaJ homolog subfamily C member 5-like [Strongylocentrotus purpuratus]|uniref:J domain-containing protein n=1 Tax=Strongylocentrotus purpuratus TaxID=7668 RepID=A0A7M7P548_STRPU|nr:dnaJ homolog subfamily C member 5-like [Strongylocentrotus purpuratus]
MGLGGDGDNPADTPEETAENATENDTGDPSSTSGKEKTTAGSDTRSMRYCCCFILYLQALRYDPDWNRNDSTADDKFKEINRAHKVLTDEKKRQIYDKYGSFGLFISDTVGDDNIWFYVMLNSKCFEITTIICFLATGCCFCCCCFCGCFGLCSECQPKSDEEDGDLTDIEGGRTGGGDSREPVRNQPEASGVNNEVFAMPEP